MKPSPTAFWQSQLQYIKLLVLDVDGVLTDGKLHYNAQGECLKVFHVQDGHGIKTLLGQNIQVAIITGRQSAINQMRASELGINYLIQGSKNKLADLQTLLKQLQLKPDQVAFMGDDLPDLAAMQAAALAFTVPDAHPDIKDHADYCTHKAGGNGAVREVCDLFTNSHKCL